MRARLCVWVLLLCLPIAAGPTSVWAAEDGLAPSSKSAVLVDADTGTVLYEKNSREKLPPASITKIMTMLLVMEALEKGQISYEDRVRTSEYASSMGGSQIFLETGEVMKLEDLLKAVAVGSANDASVALAEHLAGTEERFVEMMNRRAEELGMKDTRFQNPNGLPASDHYSTARDIAIMSRELLKHREITRFTKTYEDYLRKESKKPFWLVNTNKLVKFYEGLDGLKTGFTREAGFCLAATAKRRDLRAIAVVMGEPDVKARNREITRMLDFAFNQYANRVIYKPGQLIGKLQVDKGEKSMIEVRSPQQFSVLMKKGENADDYRTKIRWEKLKAPVRKGQLLGAVEVEKDGKTVSRMELVSAREIPKAGMWTILKRTARKLFFIPDETPAADPGT
ncbi:D-alanyl-D-alanine carboxypeptidase family protein [Kroppenstedtia eburnea]|uniref:serine-type D-Ala-D-Ala carboxypeptidase n=1 Tax=Kroppenstedtia eburnea TaxID=714067 RepID=A0A1N7IN62_9BACL|nr:D-alanyl-D-alanine carboxypeptidase family protein [Kroppenstedtia eburnea]EGK14217.1 serine-type D-Ala-D-Ala carboxypeptidase [Desmospora sp. 8437]QKI82001.1 D-alanyl-D-alanine carboxypeptidase [Kroppenstedtia eburnea]SIS38537.1 D-alanyl-D-alanine carboxypeptidase (penicillin-binding protein 5/6) [Kroppenstedtia eburnea]